MNSPPWSATALLLLSFIMFKPNQILANQSQELGGSFNEFMSQSFCKAKSYSGLQHLLETLLLSLTAFEVHFYNVIYFVVLFLQALRWPTKICLLNLVMFGPFASAYLGSSLLSFFFFFF